MFAKLFPAMPQRDAPRNHRAKFPEVSAGQRNFRPRAEGSRHDVGLQSFQFGFAVGAHAAQFEGDFDFFARRFGCLPQDIKAEGGDLIGVFAQPGLIRVAVKQAGRSGVAALLIQKQREHLHNPARDRIGGLDGGNKAERNQKNHQCAHDKTIAGDEVNSTYFER